MKRRTNVTTNPWENLFMKTRPTPQTSRFIRTREAALYLGISEKQLRRMVRLGEIAVVQRGNVWLFDIRALDAYADRQQASEYPWPSGARGFGDREVSSVQ